MTLRQGWHIYKKECYYGNVYAIMADSNESNVEGDIKINEQGCALFAGTSCR